MVRNLKNKFADFTENYDTLMGLSNIEDVRVSVFEETKREKDEIINARMNSFLESQRIRFKGSLDDILQQARNNLNDLKKYDRDELREQIDSLSMKLDSLRVTIRGLFEAGANEAKSTINDMAIEVRKEVQEYEGIDIGHKIKEIPHTSTTGHLFWKKYHKWYETIDHKIAEVNDVERNIRNYRVRGLEMINEGFRTLLQIEQMKDSVKVKVMGAFDQADKDFDEDRILIPLDNALNRIVFPEIQLELEPYEDMLDELTSGIVTDGVVMDQNIPELKRAQNKINARISEDIVMQMKKEGDRIEQDLQERAIDFVDSIVDELRSNQEKLEALLEDKEAGIEKMEHYIKEIETAKRKFA